MTVQELEVMAEVTVAIVQNGFKSTGFIFLDFAKSKFLDYLH